MIKKVIFIFLGLLAGGLPEVWPLSLAIMAVYAFPPPFAFGFGLYAGLIFDTAGQHLLGLSSLAFIVVQLMVIGVIRQTAYRSSWHAALVVMVWVLIYQLFFEKVTFGLVFSMGMVTYVFLRLFKLSSLSRDVYLK
jgi:cell shape-determining protein MreD